MLPKNHTKTVASFLLATVAALTLGACGDKKGGPPTDDDELTQKTSACDDGTFADCAREVLASAGLVAEENEALSSCKFERATPTASSADRFEVAKQAVKRTCQ